ncbi:MULTISPECIES: FKBP-type peptidyl-prolyl cis-trans isomerase [Sphingobacterium]|uniref:FKBP-type peptidyl-prolyl cis-trans isomerase n=1 Tax=Sphingobacterium TaxID=28453 RepID=UPI0013D962D7|nr:MULTISPECIES: FKBP-type peptidyl-prolyl cis-trans isomerase [unclassified Sphingobacterium]
MKNLFKTVLFAAVGTVMFASCNSKDDYDYDADNLKQEKAIDSIFTKDRAIIENYIDETFQEDSLKITYNYLGKTIKRGLWYKVITAVSDENEQAYKYQINTSGYGLPVVAPKVTLKYTARLLDGTTLENGTLVENEGGGEYDFSTNASKVINTAWYLSFFPYNIRVNEQDTRVIGGLTKNGLKKGSRIIVVTPSYWAYGARGNGQTGDKAIPANSPLVYDFEVLSIQ